MKNKETFYTKALDYVSSGNISNAKELLEQILDMDSCFGKAHYLLGWILFEYKNDKEKAKNHAMAAIEFDPTNPLGFFLYCDVLIANQNLETLKSLIKATSKLKDTDKAYVYHKLGCAYESRKQYIDAITTLHLAKEMGVSEKWDRFINDEIARIRKKIKAF